MIYSYNECLDRYGSDYKIKKAIREGVLYQKAKGIYSDEAACSDIRILTTKYPRAIFTGESAYYYYGLTDVVPTDYCLATKRTDSRIKDESVRQVFMNENLYEPGKTTMDYQGVLINIYSRERLLVELVRQRSRLPFDYYKEIIGNYRRIVDELDFFEVEKCAEELKYKDSIMRAIELEVL